MKLRASPLNFFDNKFQVYKADASNADGYDSTDSTKGPFFNLEQDMDERSFDMEFSAYAIVCHRSYFCVSDVLLCRLQGWAKQASM